MTLFCTLLKYIIGVLFCGQDRDGLLEKLITTISKYEGDTSPFLFSLLFNFLIFIFSI